MSGTQDIGAFDSGDPDFLTKKAIQERIIVPLVCVFGVLLSICANWIFPGLGLAVCILTSATVVLLSVSRSIELVIFAFLFQNVMVAIIGGSIDDFDGAPVAKATNFLLCMTIWAMCLALYVRYPADEDDETAPIMKATIIVLGVIGVYFVYGFARNGAGAIVYLRNLIIPLVCLQIALTASRYSRGEAHYPSWIAYAFLAYCYVEITFGVDFLQLINAHSYLQSGDAVLVDPTAGPEDQFSVKLFNTGLFGDLGSIIRLRGPNLHPISVAYAITTFALLCFVQKRYLQMLLFVPLMVFAGSKGAMLYFLFGLAAVWAAQRFNPKMVLWTMLAVAVIYAVVLFHVGRNADDFHVIGLIGSLKGFMSNPLGYGIGAGGNLNNNFGAEEWQTFQHQGFTDTAVESGVGVILYQMGLAGAGVLAFYLWVAGRFWKRFLRTMDPTLSFATFAIVFIITNSIFQEEALFAPLSLGLLLLLVGAGTYAPRGSASRASAQ